MNKTVVWNGVGGIEMRGLHEVDGRDSTAEPDGYWEGHQFIQVCGGFDFEGIGFCEDDEGEVLTAFGKCCMVGFGGCACGSSSVAASHRPVAVAHPRLVDYNDADNNDTYNDDNDNSAQQPLKQPRVPSVLIESQIRFDVPVDNLPTQPSAPTPQQYRPRRLQYDRQRYSQQHRPHMGNDADRRANADDN